MTWSYFLGYAGLTVLGTFCAIILLLARTYCKVREAGAFSGGQAFVADAQATASERASKADAYYAQVHSMEAAWQVYLENHYAAVGAAKPGVEDLRAMRAAFENMYDFTALENL